MADFTTTQNTGSQSANLTKAFVLAIDKEFDAHQVELARVALDGVVEQQHETVVLDFSHTAFIDSSGIGAIVYLYKRLLKQQRKMAIYNAAGQPLKLMTMLRVNQTIKFIDDLAQAV